MEPVSWDPEVKSGDKGEQWNSFQRKIYRELKIIKNSPQSLMRLPLPRQDQIIRYPTVKTQRGFNFKKPTIPNLLIKNQKRLFFPRILVFLDFYGQENLSRTKILSKNLYFSERSLVLLACLKFQQLHITNLLEHAFAQT